ncbi:hypothetical protein ACHAWF_014860 [Thalassiosira exigua]
MPHQQTSKIGIWVPLGLVLLWMCYLRGVQHALDYVDPSSNGNSLDAALGMYVTGGINFSRTGGGKAGEKWNNKKYGVNEIPQSSSDTLAVAKPTPLQQQQRTVEQRIEALRDYIDETHPTYYEENRPPSSSTRYLIFTPIKSGQGQGNHMAGLLATHLLGDEFDRIVCISHEYSSFLDAFESVHPWAIAKCPEILGEDSSGKGLRRTGEEYLRLITYETDPDECVLREKLMSGPDVLYITSNTYPRWSLVPRNYFFRFYRPKTKLLAALPCCNGRDDLENNHFGTPDIVVHLREGDGGRDTRKGTDSKSLDSLGNLLPRNTTYLVTNRVEWYDKFSSEYGWRNSGWHSVTHSALKKTWGVLGKKYMGVTGVQTTSKDDQNLQLWADWYTILIAEQVYHTHSDFSISAVHFVGATNSKTIAAGYSEELGQVELSSEYFIKEESPPLVERSLDANGTAQLQLCK